MHEAMRRVMRSRFAPPLGFCSFCLLFFGFLLLGPSELLPSSGLLSRACLFAFVFPCPLSGVELAVLPRTAAWARVFFLSLFCCAAVLRSSRVASESGPGPARSDAQCGVFGDGPGLLHDLKVWVVDGSRSPRQRGEALVDLEIPPAMGFIKA